MGDSQNAHHDKIPTQVNFEDVGGHTHMWAYPYGWLDDDDDDDDDGYSISCFQGPSRRLMALLLLLLLLQPSNTILRFI